MTPHIIIQYHTTLQCMHAPLHTHMLGRYACVCKRAGARFTKKS